MHESKLVASLVAAVEAAAEDAGASVSSVGLRIGVLSGLQAKVVRDYWERLAGPSLSVADLEITVADDPSSSAAFGLELAYVEVA